MIPLDAIEAEVTKLTAGEFDVSFPDDKKLSGDWTLAGARSAFDRQLADPDVDIVICLGVLVCHVAGAHPDLTKPVIAPIVIDPEMQSFPFADGASGKHNLVYITNLHSVDDDLSDFTQAATIRKMASLLDEPTFVAFERFLEDKRARLEAELSIDIVTIPVGDSLLDAVEAMPADVDAVYVPPLFRFSDDDIVALANELIDRKLPSFSMLGVSELDDGLLSSVGRPEDLLRVTRRIALNVQRILLGEQAEAIPVFLQESRRLAINMRDGG